MPDSRLTTSARIQNSTMKEYRKWAAATHRGVGDLLDLALRFALAKKIEVEVHESQQNAAAVTKETKQ